MAMSTRGSLSGSRQWLMCSIFIGFSLVAAYYMRFSPPAAAVGDVMDSVLKPGPFIFPEKSVELRRDYSGIKAIDFPLSFLVAAFLPGADGWNKPFQLQQAYFLFSFFPVLAVFNVEAGRLRNAGALLSYTALWAIPYQTVGGAIFIPLWFLCYTLTTSPVRYWQKSQQIPAARAKTLLPSLLLAYLLPTILLYLPYKNIDTRQFMVGLWQPSPILVNLVWWIFAKLSETTAPRAAKTEHTGDYLKPIYITGFLVSASVHLALLTYLFTTKDRNLILSNIFSPWQAKEWSMSNSLLFIFQVDFCSIFAASSTWLVQAVWDLRRLRLTTAGLGQATLLISLCTIAFGPGAAIAATWYWRETVLQQSKPKLR